MHDQMHNTQDPRPECERVNVKVNPWPAVALLIGIALIAGLLALGVVKSGAVNAATPQRATHYGEVPAWAARPCAAEDDVDCRWDGGAVKPGRELLIRKIPGTALVCVLHVDNPRRDYCKRRR